MQLGVVGLGRMGSNIVRRLARAEHRCVVFDRNARAVEGVLTKGVTAAAGLESLIAALEAPRAIWLMLPAGKATEETVERLIDLLQADDVVIDGGNSFYKDDIRRARLLRSKGIHYIDCGTSGGIWGLDRGYCLMIGGEAQAVERLDPIFRTLAPGPGQTTTFSSSGKHDRPIDQGYMHCGPSGAGHFAKMVHNAIEYGLMQSYSEGFNILRAAATRLPEDGRYEFALADIAELWRRGSVIGSWLLDLTAKTLAEDPELARYTGFVEDLGEGRWAVNTAIEEAVPAYVLSAALFARFRSRDKDVYSDKLLSALRHAFGGHIEPESKG